MRIVRCHGSVIHRQLSLRSSLSSHSRIVPLILSAYSITHISIQQPKNQQSQQNKTNNRGQQVNQPAHNITHGLPLTLNLHMILLDIEDVNNS